ncbi:ATP-binding protein [Algicola sagamiensis]|uniref:ATP-binding protein n=1 Tax=Algicola sagamiensis TaxID=163869 RepID=UPI00035C91C9|nr:ATP-binding protein [Algicola sagamiensis]
MAKYKLSPWAKTFAHFIARWGIVRSSVLTYLFTLSITLLFSIIYSFIVHGAVRWFDVTGMLFLTAIGAPTLIYLVVYFIAELDASVSHLMDSSHQEKLLNQSLQDNIRRLNYEIEERKKAFEAKRRAIDELRREIAERRKTQKEFEEQSVLLRSIVDSSPDLFYYRDENGLFAGCNKMFEILMGKKSEELIGKTPSEVFQGDAVPTSMLTDQEVVTSQSELTLDVEYMTPSGEVHWYEMLKVPFYDKHGKNIGLLGFGRDITARKLAEQALEKAYQDKGKFIATLSHELRTPLNGIVGLTRMVLDSELSEQQRSWAHTIFSSAETLGNIFNDIIDLDKVDRNELEISQESVHLDEFVNDVYNFGALLSQQKELQFVLRRKGDFDEYFFIDPTRVRQILWNLINNAVKFTSKGRITLVAECEVPTDNDDQYQITFKVSDTGIGISETDKSKVFGMYYKASQGRKITALGSGIGLAVSKSLAEAMGGNIELDSKVGEGSTFIVQIPVTRSQAPDKQSYDSKKLNILLVEDVPLNAQIAISLLEQRGHDVVWAETGEDAIALLETEDDIELVLLDMQLPDMHGRDIAVHIRGDERLAMIPVVALTANVRKAEEDLEGIHIDGALAKPISTRKLDKALYSLFGDDIRQARNNVATAPLPSPSKKLSQLDEETINEYVDALGLDAFQKSIALFEQLIPNYLNKLFEAIAYKNLEDFQSSAHKLKGAAGSVGLQGVQKQAKEFEMTEEPQWEILEKMVVEFQGKIDQDLSKLKEYVGNI